MIIFGGRGNASDSDSQAGLDTRTALLGDEWEIDLDLSQHVTVATNSSTVSIFALFCVLPAHLALLKRTRWYRTTAAYVVPSICRCRLFTFALRFDQTSGHPRDGGDVHPSHHRTNRRTTAGNRRRHVCHGRISSCTDHSQLHRTVAAISLWAGATAGRHEQSRERSKGRVGHAVPWLQRD